MLEAAAGGRRQAFTISALAWVLCGLFLLGIGFTCEEDEKARETHALCARQQQQQRTRLLVGRPRAQCVAFVVRAQNVRHGVPERNAPPQPKLEAAP